ncbi:lamin tail domain-containing protein [Streptomyces sp. WMMC940]|uniref:lamin tail domain-containing protein n=1 Tax=Streptomyces sp. WMMC940 TaxID=3015153 RepID=UPI0022B72FEB|nr:lamin tail domain-containing protein [Streptomyces sp. WMMC940]MCZ7456363.1 lamin tail domain-containing protein [Streptomyces sp. WMMC940]
MSASRNVRRLVAAALASGAIVGAMAVPASADNGHDRRDGRDRHAGHSRHHDDRNRFDRDRFDGDRFGGDRFGRDRRSSVVIGQVQHNGPRRDFRSNRSLNAEWVEVTNNGRRAVDLDGWTLSDGDGNRYRFDDLRLPARSSVRVHTGRGFDTRRDVYQGRRNHVWDSRDTATLRDSRGRVVDFESWGRGFPRR